MHGLVHDLRVAARGLTRSPRFALAVIFLLALGLGANVAVFTVVHTLLLRPLPYKDPHRLVRIWESHPERGIVRSPVSRGNFYDWRERATSFEYIEAFGRPTDRIVRIGSGDPEIVRQASGTERFIEMLGVAPVLDGEGQGVRLSHTFWQRRFGADPSAVGMKWVFEGFESYATQVGSVMPRGFDYPAGADAWDIMLFGKARECRDTMHRGAPWRPAAHRAPPPTISPSPPRCSTCCSHSPTARSMATRSSRRWPSGPAAKSS